MDTSPLRKVANVISIVSILGPIIVMFWNIELGLFLLVLGLFTASRAIRFATRTSAEIEGDSTLGRLRHDQSNQGRTIYVQLVDDVGWELPAEIADRRMAEAQARANPRDMVVGVHHVLQKTENKTSRSA